MHIVSNNALFFGEQKLTRCMVYCRRCFYKLKGAGANRCPECGCIFSPDRPASYLQNPPSLESRIQSLGRLVFYCPFYLIRWSIWAIVFMHIALMFTSGEGLQPTMPGQGVKNCPIWVGNILSLFVLASIALAWEWVIHKVCGTCILRKFGDRKKG